MSLPYRLLQHLCDGRFYSGEVLAQTLGVTRAAIWKAAKVLQAQYGLQIDAIKGRGYRLAQPLELLHADTILANMQQRQLLRNIDVHLTLPSTNTYLMQHVMNGMTQRCAVVAEHQSQGKGRLGRRWVSPFGGNLYFSMLWHFERSHAELPTLGLVVAVAIARTLQLYGVRELQLKWPNDVLCQGRKLAGILLEMHGEMGGAQTVVIGVGLNVVMQADEANAIEQPWIDLTQAGYQCESRNRLAAGILDQIVSALLDFEREGCQPFLAQWRSLDRFMNQPVILLHGHERISGVARGIDDHGALLLECDQQMKRFYSGDLSLRQGS